VRPETGAARPTMVNNRVQEEDEARSELSDKVLSEWISVGWGKKERRKTVAEPGAVWAT
jgi:hypothetical protein